MKNENTHYLSAIFIALFLLPFVTVGQDHYLKSEIIPDGVEVLYTASNAIYSVVDEPFIVELGGTAELKAGNRIELNPGFQVLTGGVLYATLEISESVPPRDKENMTVVYPNPTEELINVVSPTVVDAARLVDINGFKVLEQQDINTTEFSLDLTSIKPGIYVLEIISGKEVQQVRLEKK